ncbi:MAG TPA: hypothetical protein VGM03_06575 [Phycisphaerae bacterium]
MKSGWRAGRRAASDGPNITRGLLAGMPGVAELDRAMLVEALENFSLCDYYGLL